MFLAAGAEGAAGCPRGRAELRHVQGAIGVCLQQLFQSPHYHCVAVVGAAGLGGLSATQARHHRLHKALLQRPGYLGVCQDVRRGLGEMAGRFMQARQPGKESRRRADELR